MTVTSVEVLVEEPSMEATLNVLMPKIAPGMEFAVRVFQGKPDLLRKLPQRLRGYAAWAPEANVRVAVIVDRDNDDCHRLIEQLRDMVRASGLSVDRHGAPGDVLCRVAVEELEAWFFGDVAGLCSAYPGVPCSLADQAPYRDPDAVVGGTAEAMERVLTKAGHRVSKLEAAGRIAERMNIDDNRSRSFQVTRDGLRRLIGVA